MKVHLDAAGALGSSSRVMEGYLRERGVSLKRFHRWSWRRPLRYNRRNHRKLLIVDDRIAYVGGFNIHRQSSRRLYGETRWRDTHAAISGALVEDAARLFAAFWRGNRRWMPDQRSGRATSLVSNHTCACRHMIRCLYSGDVRRRTRTRFSCDAVFCSRSFHQQRLIRAARRGLDVRLLVPSNSDVPVTRWAAHAFYDALMSAGVRIYSTSRAVAREDCCSLMATRLRGDR